MRQRPRFDIAVGVSTGAVVVTHAFLGSEHDQVLREQLSLACRRKGSLPAPLAAGDPCFAGRLGCGAPGPLRRQPGGV
jgi:hypothetical protein